MVGPIAAILMTAAIGSDDKKKRARLQELSNRLGLTLVTRTSGTKARIDYVEKIHGPDVADYVALWLEKDGFDPEAKEPQHIDTMIAWAGLQVSRSHELREAASEPLQKRMALLRAWPDLRYLHDWAWIERPTNLMSMSIEEVIQAADAWHARFGDQIVEKAEGAPHQGRVVYRFDDGWTVQKLTTRKQVEDEGHYMSHCASVYWTEVADGKSLIYSMRDESGFPFVTFEALPTENREPDTLVQAKAEHDHVPWLYDPESGMEGSKLGPKVIEFARFLVGPNPRDWSKDVRGALLWHGSDDEVIDYVGLDLNSVEASSDDKEARNIYERAYRSGSLDYVSTWWPIIADINEFVYLPPELAATQFWFMKNATEEGSPWKRHEEDVADMRKRYEKEYGTPLSKDIESSLVERAAWPTVRFPEYAEVVEYEAWQDSDHVPLLDVEIDRASNQFGHWLHIKAQAILWYSGTYDDGQWQVGIRAEGKYIDPDGTVYPTERWPLEFHETTWSGAKYVKQDTKSIREFFEYSRKDPPDEQWEGTSITEAIEQLRTFIETDLIGIIADKMDPRSTDVVKRNFSPSMFVSGGAAQKELQEFPEEQRTFPWYERKDETEKKG